MFGDGGGEEVARARARAGRDHLMRLDSTAELVLANRSGYHQIISGNTYREGGKWNLVPAEFPCVRRVGRPRRFGVPRVTPG